MIGCGLVPQILGIHRFAAHGGSGVTRWLGKSEDIAQWKPWHSKGSRKVLHENWDREGRERPGLDSSRSSIYKRDLLDILRVLEEGDQCEGVWGSGGESQGKGLKNQTAAAGPPEFAKVTYLE